MSTALLRVAKLILGLTLLAPASAATSPVTTGAIAQAARPAATHVFAEGARPGATAAGAQAASDDRPSIVIVLTDDQRWDSLWAMPTVRGQLVDHGVRFKQSFVVNALCCPSRSTLLTGKYSHSTGVWRNSYPYGGFEAFDDRETLATVLDAAGYRTALIGKYLNGYKISGRSTYIPPGWDRWVVFSPPEYLNYGLNIDGALHRFGSAASDYSTDVLVGHAERFIRDTKGPLFLLFAPYGPHGPATPARRHAREFSDAAVRRPRNFDEADVSDKPGFIRNLPSLGASGRAHVDRLYRDQLRSLQSVDEAVGQIVDALRDTGRLEDTLLIFTSDNGIALGEHRWTEKQTVYEETIRVPLVIRYDRLLHGPRDDYRFALNVDLAPTVAEIADVPLPGAEGQSLVPLLTGQVEQWRTSFLIEHLRDPIRPFVPSYCAIRSSRYLYVVYASGDRELYDLEEDPFQLESRATSSALPELRNELKESCSPRPPGFNARL